MDVQNGQGLVARIVSEVVRNDVKKYIFFCFNSSLFVLSLICLLLREWNPKHASLNTKT